MDCKKQIVECVGQAVALYITGAKFSKLS